MDYTELKNSINAALPSGEITIAADTFTENLGALLSYCYEEQPIVIHNIQVTPDDSKGTVTISGDSDYLNLPAVAVTAMFWVVAESVQVELVYDLSSTNPNWKFSDSFPGLPAVMDHGQPIVYNQILGDPVAETAQAIPLDRFTFVDPVIVVRTIPGSKPINGVTADLKQGINFVGKMQPEGALLAIASVFNHNATLNVSGTIRKMQPQDQIQELIDLYPSDTTPVAYPWDVEEEFETNADFLRSIPGILLKVTLGLNYNIKDHIAFTANNLYIYSPINYVWLLRDTNPAFVPIQAYTGSITVSNNTSDIVMDMVSPITIGKDIFELRGNFQGLQINNLSQLAGLTNDDNKTPAANLPDTLVEIIETLAHLELTNAGISVNYYPPYYENPDQLVINQMDFTIGFPALNWHVWEDHIVMNDISCTFAFDYPLNDSEQSFPWEQPRTQISIIAALTLENVPFKVYGTLYDSDASGYAFAAEMDGEHTLPLNSFMKRYAPGVPAPSDLTINLLRMRMAPHTSYSMAMAMAEEPNPWTIALSGGNEIIISNLTLRIDYARDPLNSSENSLDGQLGGTLAFGNNGLSFSLVAELHKDIEGTGWHLSGYTAPGQPIPIGNFMSDLAEKFGLSDPVDPSEPPKPPAPIIDADLKDLAVTFNTKSKDFSFSGEVDFTLIPGQLPDESDAVKAQLLADIAVTRQQNDLFKKHFSGHLALGNENIRLLFDLTFEQDLSSQLLLATYHNEQGGEINLSDLVGTIMPGVNIPDVLTFELKDAILAHEKTGADTSSNLFIAHIGSGINLSNLPLVGKFFSPGKTLNLTYQILLTSADFAQNTVGVINSLLPEGISTLPDTAITQRLGIFAAMNIAGDILDIDLPIDVNHNPVEPSPDEPTAENPEPPPHPVKATSEDDSIKWFNIQKSIGPVHFNRIGVAYNSDDGGELKFALDASLSMGGLEISLDGLSVSSPLTRFEPHFDLKGLGIDFKNQALEIGGAFLKEHVDGHDEYDGVALLKMKTLSLSAIGSYAYVNGHPSLFIYAALNYPLGGPPFFFVTGLSLGFGYNRALRMPSVKKVKEFPLVAEAMNGKSLPANAGKETLTAELKAIHSYIPVSIGDMFLAAGISFTTFKLIDSTMLLAASFGNRFELDLLGVSTLSVPPETGKTPLALVQMDLKGAFIPDEGFVGLRGELTSASYILSKDCGLTGGFAFYSWYNGSHAGDFVMTIGGYHPHFKKPRHYPKVPRLTFTWKLDHHTCIKGDAYFALCSHALMAGGHLEISYQKGAIKAWLTAKADFLVAWKPYHYEADIHVHVGGSYHLFGNNYITVDIGADVMIWGPEFGGHASLDLGVCTVKVNFGASRNSRPQSISWNSFRNSFLPSDKLCNVTVSNGLVSKGSEGLSEGIPKYTDLTGFMIAYDGKDWTVKSDTKNDNPRTIVIEKPGEADKTIKITLSNNLVTLVEIGDQIINNPDETITILSLGIVNPKELVLLTDAFIPSKEVRWGDLQQGDPPDNNLIDNTNNALWNTNFGIGPMGISESNLTCAQIIKIEKHSGASWGASTSDFKYTINTKKAPTGLWGEKLKPGANDSQFIENAFAGLQIVPANPPTPGSSQTISPIEYQTSAITDPIQWLTLITFTDNYSNDEASARAAVRDSITTSAVSKRHNVLESLEYFGISGTIDLIDTIADDLILAPQVAV